MALVRPIEDESITLNDEDSPLYSPPIPDIEFEPVFDIPRASSAEEANRWIEMNDLLAAHDHGQRQEALLLRTDALLATVLTRAPIWIAGARDPTRRYPGDPAFTSIYARLDETASGYRQMLLSDAITTPLPGLPRASGEGQAFKAAVREALEAMLVRAPVLAPVRVPLKVVLLVVPPQQGKDLDNLALTALPAVQEVLRPPALTAYEVIELKRSPTDPAAGHLRFALGSGSQFGSTWQRVTDYVARPAFA
jgi:hypothetical protein